MAAKRVVEENKCLRSLLHRMGLNNQEIDAWVNEATSTTEKGTCSQLGDTKNTPKNPGCVKRDTGVLLSAAAVAQETDSFSTLSLKPQPSAFTQVDQTTAPFHPDKHLKSLTEVLSHENTPTDKDILLSGGKPIVHVSENQSCNGEASGTCTSANISTNPRISPCKLLTHLASNPSMDITQIIPTLDDELNSGKSEDAVSCSRAYQLLMQFATTEAKQDAIARMLEEGCVPNADSKEGCSVKNKTLSQALLDICL